MPPPPVIVFPGAECDRALLTAAARAAVAGVATPLLLGRREDFHTTALILGLRMGPFSCLFPPDDPHLDARCAVLMAAAPGRWATVDTARAALLASGALFAASQVALGRAAGVVARLGREEAGIPAGLAATCWVVAGGELDDAGLDAVVERAAADARAATPPPRME